MVMNYEIVVATSTINCACVVAVDAETEADAYATPREANSTPRSPRDFNSNPPSRYFQ